MAEQFTIEFEHKGEQQSFSGELRQLGHAHKFFIYVNGIEVVFEPDEERNYRAIIPIDQNPDKVDKTLIEKIVAELENNLK